DLSIREAIRLQQDCGLEVVTDGEFRRGSYWGRFVERLTGLRIRPALYKFRDDSGREVEFTAPHVVGKIARTQALALDEFIFLHGATTATPKITMPAPSTMHFYRSSAYAEPGIYGDAQAFFADLAKAYRGEIAALAAAGCRYIQLDEVAIAMLCD